MKETILPAAGRLVVRPDKPPEKSGSLYLAPAHAKKPTWGKVLAISPEAAEKLVGLRADQNFLAGQTVAYEFAAGHTMVLKDDAAGPEGYEVVVLKHDEVLGVVKEE